MAEILISSVSLCISGYFLYRDYNKRKFFKEDFFVKKKDEINGKQMFKAIISIDVDANPITKNNYYYVTTYDEYAIFCPKKNFSVIIGSGYRELSFKKYNTEFHLYPNIKLNNITTYFELKSKIAYTKSTTTYLSYNTTLISKYIPNNSEVTVFASKRYDSNNDLEIYDVKYIGSYDFVISNIAKDYYDINNTLTSIITTVTLFSTLSLISSIIKNNCTHIS